MQGYDPADFTEHVLLCVPRFAWYVARGFLADYGTRPINYSVQYSEQGYWSPDAALFDQIDASISEFLGAKDMCQDLTQAMDNIAEALTNINNTLVASSECNTSCGSGGSNGAGTTNPPPSTFEDDGASFPPEFDSVEEYRTYKCGAANLYIDQILTDLSYVETAGIGALAASALVVAFLTPIPFDDILILSATALAFAAQGILTSAAINIQAAINADKTGYVCEIYNAETAQIAYDNLRAKIDAEGSLNGSEKLLGKYFVNFEALNTLFDYSSLTAQQTNPGGVDCADCECPSFGTAWTVIERTDTYAILESQSGAGTGFLYASVRTQDANAVTGGGGPFGPYCGETQQYSVSLVSGTVTDWGERDDDGNVVVTAWTPWNGAAPKVTSSRHFYSRDTNNSTYRLRFEFT